MARAALGRLEGDMTVSALRTWETPHLMVLASGSEASLFPKFIKVGEWTPRLGIFDDPDATEPEGDS
jgi:hypothetical protein